MDFTFHPDAKRELEEAVAWYDGLSQRPGDEFLLEFENALARIGAFPEAWAALSANTRRCRLKKFPYAVVYRALRGSIQVIAVMNLHRKPDYWAERVD